MAILIAMPSKKGFFQVDCVLSMEPSGHLGGIIPFVARSVSFFSEIDMELLQKLGVEAICAAKQTNGCCVV